MPRASVRLRKQPKLARRAIECRPAREQAAEAAPRDATDVTGFTPVTAFYSAALNSAVLITVTPQTTHRSLVVMNCGLILFVTTPKSWRNAVATIS